MADFAFALEIEQRTDLILKRHLGIDSVELKEVDSFQFEPAETSFACFLHVIRFAADTAKLLSLRIAQNSELRRDDNLIAVTFQHAAD